MRPSDLALLADSPQWLLGLRHAQAIASVMPGRLALSDIAWAVCFGISEAALGEARSGFHDNVCLAPAVSACRCDCVIFARVPALPKAAKVEWQLFLSDGGREATSVRRCRAEQNLTELLVTSRSANWALVRSDVTNHVLRTASVEVVIIPVEGFDDDDVIGCVVSQ